MKNNMCPDLMTPPGTRFFIRHTHMTWLPSL